MEILLDLIRPNPEQPRQVFDEEGLQGLAQSIAEVGVIQPVVVYKNGDGYILLDGERRWRASRMAGLKKIPVVLRETEGNSQEKLSLAIVANLQRDDLNPIEEARAFERLWKDHGISQAEIGQKVGRSDVHVSCRLKLLELDEEIQDLIAAGMLTSDPKVANAFLGVEDPAKRVRLAKRCAMRKFSIATIRRLCGQASVEKKVNTKSGRQYHPQVERGEAVWSILDYSGRLPASTLRKAAEKTCEVCPMFDIASDGTCRECPLSEFVKYLLKDVNDVAG